ncbi:hypothetical protein EV649_0916 [Kribbella sp. VKM Ac-2569]|uniref:hypothetical protein n=1 Tax=Kribbella sp. VKM Ac-2569 TaxID=2512220 RepID=UPI00102C4E35|nr:hypothetical protein [Kribbella sp. VKM Ac-2569]RZT27162.1 hypothetical protein EV649_0916 [Kribbella sp. VKM Ac-2569]
MLKSASKLLLTLTITVATIAQPLQADAGETRAPKPGPNYVWKCIKALAICDWFVKTTSHKPGSVKTGGKKPVKSITKRPERICLQGGAAHTCTSVLGNWSNSRQCYLRRLDPQPPRSDPAWQGHTDGAIWTCVSEYDDRFVTKWVWIPGKPDTVVVDPVTLVYEAIADMHLAAPLINTAPGSGQIGLVNMPVWLWVRKTENTWGPIVRSASVPGLSVTATAQVKAINWSMGDGKTVRCEGPGTPYDKSMGVKASPTCGHRYVKTSRKLPNCKYPVTAVAQWDITWQSTLGDTGQISMTQQAETQLRIGEAVPVLVDPDGGDAVAPAAGGC